MWLPYFITHTLFAKDSCVATSNGQHFFVQVASTLHQTQSPALYFVNFVLNTWSLFSSILSSLFLPHSRVIYQPTLSLAHWFHNHSYSQPAMFSSRLMPPLAYKPYLLGHHIISNTVCLDIDSLSISTSFQLHFLAVTISHGRQISVPCPFSYIQL